MKATVLTLLAVMASMGPLRTADEHVDPRPVKLRRKTLDVSRFAPFQALFQITGERRHFADSSARSRLETLLEGRWESGRRNALKIGRRGPSKSVITIRKPKLIEVLDGKEQLPLLFFKRSEEWFAVSASVLVGKAAGSQVVFLDADLDGSFGGDADFVRVDQGAFISMKSLSLLCLKDGLFEFELNVAKRSHSFSMTKIKKSEKTPDETWSALGVVNRFRTQVGQSPLRINEKRLDGCYKHARYLYLNSDGPGMSLEQTHNQIPGRPGYTPEGHAAAKVTNVSYFSNLSMAVSGELRTMLHRVAFLGSPSQGFAAASHAGSKLDWVDGYSVIWGADPTLKEGDIPIFVPGVGEVGVPRHCAGEYPDIESDLTFYDSPRGFPVSVCIDDLSIAKANLFLLTQDGTPVPGRAFSPWKPINSSRPRNGKSVFFIAEDVLAGETTYTAVFEGEIRGSPGRPFRFEWVFTTRAR